MSYEFDHTRLRVFPLDERRSLTRVEQILVKPDSQPAPLNERCAAIVKQCAERILRAHDHGSAIILMYGAHLLRNGVALILTEMMQRGWVTHLATNGAGTIHDWEYAWLGRSTESVLENVASGTFGTWDETGRYIHCALHAGAINNLGYGASLGKFIAEDGATFPHPQELEHAVGSAPETAGAKADLLHAMALGHFSGGRMAVEHRWKHASILAQAYLHKVPLTVHPGIGYDIISNHPMFDGAVIGRTAATDFRRMCSSVDLLDGGVVLSVGSAIMGPQVFEKALSCVHNVRFQEGRPAVRSHSIYVVDLQEGGNWDWTTGEPPKDNPAYYLRFCKSFSRMGGEMQYAQADNLAFIHNLLHELLRTSR